MKHEWFENFSMTMMTFLEFIYFDWIEIVIVRTNDSKKFIFKSGNAEREKIEFAILKRIDRGKKF